jgi:hypothetical protein
MSPPPGNHCVASYQATYAVLKAEKILTGLGIETKLIPVPRQISSNCGISLRFPFEAFDRASEALACLLEDLEGYYRLENDAYIRIELPSNC